MIFHSIEKDSIQMKGFRSNLKNWNWFLMCGLLSVVDDRSKVKVVDDTTIWKTKEWW
jgi:hypothetical protein